MTTHQPAAAPDTDALLRQILERVSVDRRRGRLELVLAIILSLATLSSTWCGYQANQWGGKQSGNQAAADTAERKAAEYTIVALQLRTFDGIALLEFWSALRENDAERQAAVRARVRPQLRAAIDAALADGMLHDPSKPGPLQRPEYILAEEQAAAKSREDAALHRAQARTAGAAADSYVILTLTFASVLFFGGITGTFTARRVRIGLGCIALLLFLLALVQLAKLPIAAG